MKRTALKRRGRNKYGNQPRTYGGREYHSRKEADYAFELDLRKKATTSVFHITDWKPQVPVKLEVNGKLVTTYIVDFLVTHDDGHEEWVEVKGFETPEWRIKEKLFRAIFPERKLTVIR